MAESTPTQAELQLKSAEFSLVYPIGAADGGIYPEFGGITPRLGGIHANPGGITTEIGGIHPPNGGIKLNRITNHRNPTNKP
ncbi:hypothetical protein ACSU64_10045 [Bacillaceae bacterium C204]|uniref:hypothetical protein n=1 Tax=Neobacillus sp. 204 TaxID=3383351 RepID=UPI003978DB28